MPIPSGSNDKPGRCGKGGFLDLRPQTPAEVFYICRQSLFAARNARRLTRSTRDTCASGASGRSRSRTRRGRTPTPPRCAAGSKRDRTRCGATATSCPCRRRRAARCRPAGRRCCGPTGSPSSSASREVWIKNDAANPTHSFKDRVVSVALARARELGFQTIACASTGNLANAVAAHAAAAGLESYVFIPSDLEEQKVLATGVYGTNLVSVRGNYDDVNRLCTELVGGARLGVREHQHAAVLLARDRRRSRSRPPSSSGSSCPTASSPRSPRDRCSRRSRAGSRSGSSVGLLTASCRRSTAPRPRGCSPVATAFEDGQDFCRPVKPDTIAKSLAIGNPGRRSVRARPGAPHRRLDRGRDRRRDPRGDQAAGADDRDLHRDRRRGHGGGAGQARRAGRDRSGRAGRRLHHRRGAEDASTVARGTFEAWEIEPTLESFEQAAERVVAVA